MARFAYGVVSLQPAFEDRPIPYLSFGNKYPSDCADHVENTVGASRVYIIASKSLATNTDALERLQKTLGDKVVGTRIGMTPHTLWSEILDIVNTVRPLNVDCIVTLGAGSITDGSKIIAWALTNDISTREDLATMWSASPTINKDLKPPTIRVIAIPTSLSGGEYQSIAGGTNDQTHEKCLFTPPARNPSLVILDPGLTTTTPSKVWLSSGVRAIDHCVETLCSLESNEKGDTSAVKGLKILIPSLLRTKRDPNDLDARFQSQMGVIQAMDAVGSGVPMGASHAIGHQLGPLGVGHGETSCVMLPAVCKWNWAKDGNRERQAKCLEVLVKDEEVLKLVEANGLDAGRMDLGDVLDLYIRALGMPRSLQDVGVGRDKLESLATNALKDHWIQTNPIKITEKGQVMEILEMVVETEKKEVKVPGLQLNGHTDEHQHGPGCGHGHENNHAH
jgi:alcohol dehydrogenase class IV